MGALSPIFLVAAVAAAVPLFLHLFHRQEARRRAFPALRYLERTEREHARRIRTRQLLLLFLRVAAVLVVVGAGARLFVRGRGSAHPATALVIVLDNSLSSGTVVGQVRALDHLEDLARRTLEAAGEDDRVWVVRAGEPWLPAVPVDVAEARRIVDATTVSDARGDLSQALSRAAALVARSELPAREIHLLSDLQASAFDPDAPAPAGDVPVVVWAGSDVPPANHAVSRVLVGGGLPPLQGQRSEIAVETRDVAPTDSAALPVRVVLEDRVRGAGGVPPGGALSLPLPSARPGWTLGYAETDPDALRADDRRYFAFRARPAPTVAVSGDPGRFVTEALAVLQEAGRLRPVSGAADAWISAEGTGLAEAGPGAAVLVIPPADPTALPALNRRLADAGIPWQLERRAEVGETDLRSPEGPRVLEGVRVRRWYDLTLAASPPAPPGTLARVAGRPWAVEGSDASGRRYLLLASALDPASTDLPLSAEMVRFLDWVTSQWAAAGGGPGEHVAGDPLSAPRAADRVRLPSDSVLPVDGTRMVTATGRAGFYTFLDGDSTVAVEAVNPPVAESDLTPLPTDRIGAAVGPDVTVVRRERSWDRAIFRARQGPELWRPLLLAALLILLVEATVAAAGRVREQGGGRSRPEASHGAP